MHKLFIIFFFIIFLVCSFVCFFSSYSFSFILAFNICNYLLKTDQISKTRNKHIIDNKLKYFSISFFFSDFPFSQMYQYVPIIITSSEIQMQRIQFSVESNFPCLLVCTRTKALRKIRETIISFLLFFHYVISEFVHQYRLV